LLVNIDEAQSLAVRSRLHTPVVFDDPEKFVRTGFYEEKPILAQIGEGTDEANASRRYLLEVARSARDASALVREAWSGYKTPVDYGIQPMDLNKVAALIHAGMPTRLYYTAYRHNAFDTHVHQGDLHARLITYVSDGIAGFFKDLERIGQADRVSMLVFSEFGRRVPENANLGTDHGTANFMFLIAGEPHRVGRGRQLDPHRRFPARVRHGHRGLARLQGQRKAARREVRDLPGVRLTGSTQQTLATESTEYTESCAQAGPSLCALWHGFLQSNPRAARLRIKSATPKVQGAMRSQ
jgi:hypothetical protein